MKKEQSIKAKERKLGGYHKHGGRGIRGWYKGYWCDSSWELAFVIYNLEHNIKFERNTTGYEYVYDGITRKYFPDFYMNDLDSIYRMQYIARNIVKRKVKKSDGKKVKINLTFPKIF